MRPNCTFLPTVVCWPSSKISEGKATAHMEWPGTLCFSQNALLGCSTVSSGAMTIILLPVVYRSVTELLLERKVHSLIHCYGALEFLQNYLRGITRLAWSCVAGKMDELLYKNTAFLDAQRTKCFLYFCLHSFTKFHIYQYDPSE